MEKILTDAFGIDPLIFRNVVLPLFIFCARIADVSINTVRIIFMLQSKRLLSTFLGFFEALIWLVAISQIFQNLTSWPTYLAYAGGFASGIFVGMLIEEKLAIGRVVVRVITTVSAQKLVDHLKRNGYRFSNVPATSEEGEVNIIFTVIKREDLTETIAVIKTHNPRAFYTVEGVKKVSEDVILDDRGFSWKKKLFQKKE